jgi:hypothetical protein
MNANELANLLDECILDGSTDLVCVEQAATMLRQQQTKIEALKAENKFFKDLMSDVEILKKAQKK